MYINIYMCRLPCTDCAIVLLNNCLFLPLLPPLVLPFPPSLPRSLPPSVTTTLFYVVLHSLDSCPFIGQSKRVFMCVFCYDEPTYCSSPFSPISCNISLSTLCRIFLILVLRISNYVYINLNAFLHAFRSSVFHKTPPMEQVHKFRDCVNDCLNFYIRWKRCPRIECRLSCTYKFFQLRTESSAAFRYS